MTEYLIKKTKVVIFEHKHRVSKFLTRFITNLIERSVIHDDSKLGPDELGPYSEAIEEFGKYSFGSEEHEKLLVALGPAIDLHRKKNRHHPEYFETGIHEMDLTDIIEMLVDWKAASLNNGQSGDLMNSINIQCERYDISPQLKQILINTARNFGMIDNR
jgi:hypothetical protein